MVIVRIANGTWPALGEGDVKNAIKAAIDLASKLAVSYGYYLIAKSHTTNSMYFAKKKRPPLPEVLRISDHSPGPRAFENVSIIFPSSLKEGRYGNGMFFADATKDASIRGAFLMADVEIRRRIKAAAPPLVVAWIQCFCKFAS